MTDILNKTADIIGLGYVGLSLAIAFWRKIKTIGFDIKDSKLSAYCEGYDTAGEMESAAFKDSTQLSFTDQAKDLALADFVVVAVPTPIDNAK